MELRQKALSAATLMLAVCSLLSATTINYTMSGTLGPILSGADPVAANGQAGVIQIAVSSTLLPTTTTATSATYTLPIGAVNATFGGATHRSTSKSTLKYTIPATGRDNMIITTSCFVEGISVQLVGTIALAHGSFTSAVKKHPQKFSPTPQTLSAAKTAGGAGSKFKYTVPLIGSTVLGLKGTASN